VLTAVCMQGHALHVIKVSLEEVRIEQIR
jgi:hypothetical protein